MSDKNISFIFYSLLGLLLVFGYYLLTYLKFDNKLDTFILSAFCFLVVSFGLFSHYRDEHRGYTWFDGGFWPQKVYKSGQPQTFNRAILKYKIGVGFFLIYAIILIFVGISK